MGSNGTKILQAIDEAEVVFDRAFADLAKALDEAAKDAAKKASRPDGDVTNVTKEGS